MILDQQVSTYWKKKMRVAHKTNYWTTFASAICETDCSQYMMEQWKVLDWTEDLSALPHILTTLSIRRTLSWKVLKVSLAKIRIVHFLFLKDLCPVYIKKQTNFDPIFLKNLASNNASNTSRKDAIYHMVFRRALSVL